jgi:hypothetical protein
MGDILKRVVKVTTFIRARGLNHGQFSSFTIWNVFMKRCYSTQKFAGYLVTKC